MLGRGRRDEVVEALAIDAHDAVVDVGAGPPRLDAPPVELDRDGARAAFGGLSTR